VELARHPKVNDLMETEINHIQRDLANYERVRRFTLLDRQFTIEDGELTPTQKVRRKAIEERYRNIIDSMYEGVS
jgi:long-chain acyl-CoA synthetase